MGARSDRRDTDQLADRLAGELRETLCAGDGGGAAAVIGRARDAGMSPVEIDVRVVGEAMHQIGEMWECGELGVDQEHLATAIAEQLLATTYWRILAEAPGGGSTVVLAAAQGERHVLGLRMIADALEGRGHRVVFLGADVPVEALVDAVVRLEPDLVGLSSVLRANAPALVYAVRAMGALGVRVLVGGPGVPDELAEAGLPVVESALDLPEDLAEVPPAADWFPRLEELESELEVRESSPGATPPTGTGELLSASATASAELVRRAVRSSFRHRRLALTDPVTQLPNRLAWDDRMASLPTDFRGSIAMLDIDEFKRVNDRLGHDAGDRLLFRLGATAREWLRETDFVARFGGDEFAVLLPGADEEEALRVCDRLRVRFAAITGDDGDFAGVTLSIGIADWRAGPRATMLAADSALYAAKRAGRDQVLAST